MQYDSLFPYDRPYGMPGAGSDNGPDRNNCNVGPGPTMDRKGAKQLVRGEPNVSYICSRYYRAPELIFGATDYTSSIDVWSAGCVLAELLLGQPIFPGDSGVDQLVEIIKVLGTPTREQIREMNPNYTEFKFPQIKAHPWTKVLGTPTREQIREMNPNYTEFKFPQIKAHPWTKVFRPRTPPEAIALCSHLLEYTPTARLTPLEACAHSFFDELRDPNLKLPNGREKPSLFNFTTQATTLYNGNTNPLDEEESSVCTQSLHVTENP
ncbi:UNVERIFIED_CONTAM: hypothetical protein FKN15_065245 [Acipenser sinensis]